MKNTTQNSLRKVKYLVLLVLSFMMSNAFAGQRQGSSFRLLLPPNGEHTIVLDNIFYKGVYDRFKIDGQMPGNHRLKIVKLIFSRRGYLVNKIVLFNGVIFIPNNAKVWASVNNNGRFIVERTLLYEDGRQNFNRGNGNNRDRRNDDYYDDDWYGNNHDYDRREPEDNDYNRGNNQPHGGDNRSGYTDSREKSRSETFTLTLDAIRKQSFDTERLKIAKNAAVSQQLLSNEIAEITKLFSFESTRLEFAKYAYLYTLDKENYVIVQNAFQFSSSVSELQDYIAQNR